MVGTDVDLDRLVQEYMGRFRDEWLLFEVTEADSSGWPIGLRLIAHHGDREKLTDIALARGLQRTLVRFAGEAVPEGTWAIL